MIHLFCSVTIETKLRSGRSGFDTQQGQGIILFATVSRPTPTQRVTASLSSEVKRPEREADDMSPSIAEVKSAWFYSSFARMFSWPCA
jgi:hypothetical protein